MEKHKSPARLPKWIAYALFLLLCLGVLFVFRNIRPKTLHTTYSLFFQDIYKSSPTAEIAGFDEGERWKGNFTLDSVRSLDGETGMNIFARDGAATTVTQQKRLDLARYDTIFTYIFIDSKEDLQGIQSLKIAFADGKGNGASYQLQNLVTGWNYIQMKKGSFISGGIDFSGIVSTAIELTAKKSQTAKVTFDRIWAQQPLQKSDFTRVDPTAVSLQTINKKTFLHISALAPTSLTFAKSTDLYRFSYTVALSPLKFGTFGLSFLTEPGSGNGYYIMVTGKLMDEWRLLKKMEGRETVLQQGKLPANTFEKQAMVWLRAEKSGDTISVSYTLNGQQYQPVTEFKDREFSHGYFGIVAAGSYLIDSVEVKE